MEHTQPHIDKAAEAIFGAHPSRGTVTWEEFCRMAEAVIAALQLTEEWAVRYAHDGEMREWSCGHEVLFDSQSEAEDRSRFLRCIDEPREQSAEVVSRIVGHWGVS